MLILVVQEFLSPNKSIEDLCKYMHYVETLSTSINDPIIPKFCLDTNLTHKKYNS
jgi:hypothetical protein